MSLKKYVNALFIIGLSFLMGCSSSPEENQDNTQATEQVNNDSKHIRDEQLKITKDAMDWDHYVEENGYKIEPVGWLTIPASPNKLVYMHHLIKPNGDTCILLNDSRGIALDCSH